MKKSILTAAAILLSAVAMNAAQSPDLKDLFGKASSALGGVGGSEVLNAINNFVASSSFEVADLVGSWKYSSPAVTFKSDDAVKKIGGSAAASAVEAQLEPYYKKVGISSLTLNVKEDQSFTMKLGKATLTGKLEKDAENNLLLKFNAFGKVSLGKVSAYATKAGNTLNLTFDASKLISIVKTVSSITSNATLTTLSKMLEAYDGIFIGFKLEKQ